MFPNTSPVSASTGDRWQSSDAAAERHDHEVHGSETGAGAEALPPHREAETGQTVTVGDPSRTHEQ